MTYTTIQHIGYMGFSSDKVLGVFNTLEEAIAAAKGHNPMNTVSYRVIDSEGRVHLDLYSGI